MPFLLYDQSLKLFSKKILETFKLLLIILRISLEEISNTNLKRPKIKYHISSISNLF